MGYSLRAQGDTIQSGIMEYMIDTKEDLAAIKKSICAPGSVVICVEDSSVYMLTTDMEWKEL